MVHVTAGLAAIVSETVARKSSGRHRHLQLTQKLFHATVKQRIQLSNERLFVGMIDR